MSDVLIELENVSKKYCRHLKRSLWYGAQDISQAMFRPAAERNSRLRPSEFWAIQDVSLQLRQGECLALIGRNGAGKSTLLKLVTGLIRPDRGRICVYGKVGALIELGVGFHPLLSGRENVYVNAAILGLSRREVDRRFDEIVDFAEIGSAIDDPVRSYSTGMRVRLGFAVASSLVRDIVLIDEVLAVGDAGFRLKCYNRILSMIDNGVAAILVSHDVNCLFRVCNRGAVLDGGKLFDARDLSEAVCHYESLSLADDIDRDQNRPAEASTVAIREVETCDNRFTRTKSFRSGADIVFAIRYQAARPLPNVTLHLRFGSARMGDFASLSNHTQQVTVPIEMGTHCIHVRLNKVPLLAGTYYARVAIFDADRQQLFDLADVACAFQITAPAPDPWSEFFTVRLEHDWPQPPMLNKTSA